MTTTRIKKILSNFIFRRDAERTWMLAVGGKGANEEMGAEVCELVSGEDSKRNEVSYREFW